MSILTKSQLQTIVKLQERIDKVAKEMRQVRALTKEFGDYEDGNVDCSVLSQLSAASGALEEIIEREYNGD